jgi:hypothetical protein
MTAAEIIQELIKIHTTPYVNSLSMRGRKISFEQFHAQLDALAYSGKRPVRSLQRITPELINEALYKTDPCYTCCVENECYDEYSAVADHTWQLLNKDLTIYQALEQALIASFGEDLLASEDIDKVVASLVGMDN